MMLNPRQLATATTTGVAPVIHWRTPDGEYRNAASPSKVISIDVEANADPCPTRHDGIAEVRFAISVNGVLNETRRVSTMSVRTPTYSTQTGRQGYAAIGSPAPFWGHGILLDLATKAGGTITIVATAYTSGDETQSTGTLTIYNDTDGVDRRPSNKTIYYSEATGNDANAGTLGSPVKTLQKAIGLSGTSGDCGGATVIALDETPNAGGSYSATAWHTSGAWRLTIKATGANRRIARVTPESFTAPLDYITGLDGNANLVFQGFEFDGPGPTVFVPSTRHINLTDIDCKSYHWAYDPARVLPHVDYARAGDGYLGFEGAGSPAGTANRYSWGHLRQGCARGWTSYSGVYDGRVERCVGPALQTFNDETAAPIYSTITVAGSRYAPGQVLGFGDSSYGGTIKGGTDLILEIPYADVATIFGATPAANEVIFHTAPLTANTYWGVKLSGFAAGNNGTFPVIGAGFLPDGVTPYILIYNPAAVAGAGTSTGRIETAKLSDGTPFTADVHPDVLQILGSHNGAQFCHIRVEDCKQTRSFVSDANPLTRTVFKNIWDGSSTDTNQSLQWSFMCSALTDCWFINLTIGATNSLWNDGAGTYTRCSMVDSVWGTSTHTPFGGTWYHRNNHGIANPAYGGGNTYGAWFATTPSEGATDGSPATNRRGTASELTQTPDKWGFALAV